MKRYLVNLAPKARVHPGHTATVVYANFYTTGATGTLKFWEGTTGWLPLRVSHREPTLVQEFAPWAWTSVESPQ